jgi:TatA/E family protein of Tat protein translocase
MEGANLHHSPSRFREGMGKVSPLLNLFLIVLLFFGAKRISELARSIGKGTREFRKGISEGGTEDEAQVEEDRKEKDEKEPLLSGKVRETPLTTLGYY